jgi:6-pyruvoyltetrahydropterin/6-carboxytetrahydropterin synthase
MESKNMYTVTVIQDFIAQHYLIGGDWGEENHLHSHPYKLEVRLEGDKLDKHGYLVDIVDIENAIKKTIDYFRDKTLNDLPEFEGLNPSIEHFTRILCQKILAKITAQNFSAISTVLWENDEAWASYRMDV